MLHGILDILEANHFAKKISAICQRDKGYPLKVPRAEGQRETGL
ncbi:MAG TPA: hypothetical protein VKM55_03630 [Candidatus Lokiarchaeia archaeon]|nr:hypothetical protein [Candidatus Lokiarchaeia archaeon]